MKALIISALFVCCATLASAQSMPVTATAESIDPSTSRVAIARRLRAATDLLERALAVPDANEAVRGCHRWEPDAGLASDVQASCERGAYSTFKPLYMRLPICKRAIARVESYISPTPWQRPHGPNRWQDVVDLNDCERWAVRYAGEPH